MKVHELETTPRKSRKRVGRGIAAGQGKTAGRGTKGQNSRTGKKFGHSFMGGQSPLMRGLPKLGGFKSMRVPAQVVYLDQLAAFASKTADNATLAEAGLVSTPSHAIKIIVRGELTTAITVKVQAASAGAIQAITKAGGTFQSVPVPLQKSSKKKEA